jgi:hypothetical protein
MAINSPAGTITETYPRLIKMMRWGTQLQLENFIQQLAADNIQLTYSVKTVLCTGKIVYNIQLTIPDQAAYTLYMLKYHNL